MKTRDDQSESYEEIGKSDQGVQQAGIMKLKAMYIIQSYPIQWGASEWIYNETVVGMMQWLEVMDSTNIWKLQ